METNKYSGESAYTRDVASSYEKDRMVEGIWRKEQEYAEKVIQAMPDGSRVLDLPVGTGRFFEYFQARNIQVVGVDISESMLQEAARKIASTSIELCLGDARALDYPENAFDFVLCWRLLHLLPSDVLREVICELARVTSGKLYFQVYVRDYWYYPLRFMRIIGRILSGLRAKRSSRKMPWSHIQSYEYGETMLINLFSKCGLRIAAIDTLGLYGALKVKVFVVEKV
jgi:SAM-dependent methyltransferase